MSFYFYFSSLLLAWLASSPLYASEGITTEQCTHHVVDLGGKLLSYTATAGYLSIHDEQEQSLASLFYVAYSAENTNSTPRPITFCFNGGPGSASLWLHLGGIGPHRILLPSVGVAPPPYAYTSNPYTLLAFTDLVFVDPVSTGYSRPAPGVEAKRFHSVEGDIQSLASFIQLYITRYGLWNVPKFLLGESYGTFRVAALARYLNDSQFLSLNGIILISTVLNFGTLRNPNNSNDLPYPLYLPSYTAAAHYHNKLDAELQRDKNKALAEAEAFAYGDYATALLWGDELPQAKREAVALRLSRLTGISKEQLLRQRLRLDCADFTRELLKEQDIIIGRWDSRYAASALGLSNRGSGFDPTAEAVLGPFTATFNSYLRDELNWKSDLPYLSLANVKWDYLPYLNRFASVSDQLAAVMAKNPNLHLFVASGVYDLATPYWGTHYTLSHLGIDKAALARIEERRYDAGHMIYLEEDALKRFREELFSFYKRAINKDFP